MNSNGLPDVQKCSVIECTGSQRGTCLRGNIGEACQRHFRKHDETFVEGPWRNLRTGTVVRLLCLKYGFSMLENRQIRLFAREGV